MSYGDGGRRSRGVAQAGMNAKRWSLITLTIQNSALILVLYYSRTMPLVESHRYLASTAVFLNEVVKLGVCLTIALYEVSRNAAPSVPVTSLFGTLTTAVFTGDSWKLAIPAALYTLQNSLQYVAITHVEAATLQVTYQFKILPTAVFSVLILSRSLTARKWTALALLMFGVAVVQLPHAQNAVSFLASKDMQHHWRLPRSLEAALRWNENAPPERKPLQFLKRSATYEGIHDDLALEHPPRNELLGLAAALLSCTVSALGSVYFEKIIKEQGGNKTSIWIRNVQLSVYSLFPAFFIGVIFVDGEQIAKHGFFQGYNWVVCVVVALQSFGGIMVALCVYYADTLAKSIATSLSILLSLFMSMIFFDFNLTANFFVGTCIVMYATWLYNNEDARQQSVPSIQVPESEKKDYENGAGGPGFRIKMPGTPFKDTGLTTSTPGSPALSHKRSTGYFADHKKE